MDDFIELSEQESKEIAELFNHTITSLLGFNKTALLALYGILLQELKEQGGCDHSVGICSCDHKRTLAMMADKLGFKQREEAWSYEFPTPKNFVS